MEEQLASLTGSLCQVGKTLLPLVSIAKSGSLSNDHREIYNSLLSSKHEILDAIVMINECLWQSGSINAGNQGQIVLAPRFMNGSVSLDYAIITHIRTMRNIMTSLDDAFDRLDDCVEEEEISDPFLSIDDQSFCVSWLRPRSVHEANSHGMTFHGAQLQLTAHHRWKQELEALELIQEGDLVLFHNLSNSLHPKHGLWLQGRVVRIFYDEQNLQIHAVEDGFYVVVSRDLRSVTALPRSSNRQQQQQQQQITAASVQNKSSTQETEQDEDDFTTLPQYFSYAAQQQEQLLNTNIGSWERHTKGIGSKLLAKMGYKRSTRQGLGREGQGVAVPIQAMLKPLPKGLGLDFINQERSKDDPMSLVLDPDRMRKEIVSSFNNRPLVGHSSSSSSSNKKHKANSHHDTDQDHSSRRSVFDLINKVESKPSVSSKSSSRQHAAISKSGSRPPGSSNSSLKKIF